MKYAVVSNVTCVDLPGDPLIGFGIKIGSIQGRSRDISKGRKQNTSFLHLEVL